MEKLELKHLAPYLPYGLQIKTPTGIKGMISASNLEGEKWMSPAAVIRLNIAETKYKPILRPLSDLTKEIEHNGAVKPLFHFMTNRHDRNNVDNIKSDIAQGVLQYDMMEMAFELHLDVFRLIPAGLAVNYNDVV